MTAYTKYSTSAGGIVLNPEGRVLIVNQRGKSWSFPKGHVEAGENNLEAAKREIYEETGVAGLEYVKDLGSYKRSVVNDSTELKTIFMFLFRTGSGEPRPVDPNIPEARWVDEKDVPGLLTHSEDGNFFIRFMTEIQK